MQTDIKIGTIEYKEWSKLREEIRPIARNRHLGERDSVMKRLETTTGCWCVKRPPRWLDLNDMRMCVIREER